MVFTSNTKPKVGSIFVAYNKKWHITDAFFSEVFNIWIAETNEIS
jgi:hypothetical protein